MLSTQVEYWKLMETKRHNLVSEQQNQEQLGYTARSTSAQERTAEANVRNASANLANAETNRKTLEYQSQNAAANLRNAETNAKNAAINAMNAYTNRLNAASQAKQAEASITTSRANSTQADVARRNLTNLTKQAEASLINAQSTMRRTQFDTTGGGYQLAKASTAATVSQARSRADEVKLKASELPYTQALKSSEVAVNRAQLDKIASDINLNTAKAAAQKATATNKLAQIQVYSTTATKNIADAKLANIKQIREGANIAFDLIKTGTYFNNGSYTLMGGAK